MFTYIEKLYISICQNDEIEGVGNNQGQMEMQVLHSVDPTLV